MAFGKFWTKPFWFDLFVELVVNFLINLLSYRQDC